MRNNILFKECTKCKIEKDIKKFSWQNKSKGCRHPWCKSCKNNYKKQWNKDNKNYCKEYQKQWDEDNREKRNEHTKRWYKDNRPIINKYIKNRLNTNPTLRLKHYISNQIRSSLKSNKAGRRWEDLVRYTIIDLKQHLEKQFESNMSWENYGEWHIDHCRPVSWFDNSEEGVVKAWKLENLQPMWAHENLVKGNRWESPRKVKTAI